MIEVNNKFEGKQTAFDLYIPLISKIEHSKKYEKNGIKGSYGTKLNENNVKIDFEVYNDNIEVFVHKYNMAVNGLRNLSNILNERSISGYSWQIPNPPHIEESIPSPMVPGPPNVNQAVSPVKTNVMLIRSAPAPVFTAGISVGNYEYVRSKVIQDISNPPNVGGLMSVPLNHPIKSSPALLPLNLQEDNQMDDVGPQTDYICYICSDPVKEPKPLYSNCNHTMHDDCLKEAIFKYLDTIKDFLDLEFNPQNIKCNKCKSKISVIDGKKFCKEYQKINSEVCRKIYEKKMEQANKILDQYQ